MTTVWVVRGQETLLSHSRSSDPVKAKREWRMTFAYEDLGKPVGTCELCGHPDIRHKFEIENTVTSKYLWVGSECIKKFVPVYENGREVTNEDEKARLVDRIVATVKGEAHRERALTLLKALSKRERRFADPKWAETWALGYSVKQLQWIAVAAKEASLPFNAADFKINTRRGRVREQLYALREWQYRQLRAALTPARRREVDTHFGLVVR